MGSSWPAESAVVLQWLTFGVFINAVAQTPYAALQGAARPDLIAKLHLLELPVYAVSISLLARSHGLVGVAMAWSLRVVVDAIALLLLAHRTLGLPMLPTFGNVWTMTFMLAALGGAALPMTLGLRVAYVAVVGVLFAAISWRRLLTLPERSALLGWIRSPRSVEVATTEPIV
jgi:O-antigen/teichoic acid export membrane protein